MKKFKIFFLIKIMLIIGIITLEIYCLIFLDNNYSYNLVLYIFLIITSLFSFMINLGYFIFFTKNLK
jgi:predicted permease